MRAPAAGEARVRRPYAGWRAAMWGYAALFYLFLYGPLATIAVLSFNASEVTGFPVTGWTLGWYREVLSSPDLLAALWHSVSVGALAAVIATALALMLALAFRHDFPGKQAIFNLVLLPIIMPGIIAGIVLLIFFGYLGVRSALYSTVLVAHVNLVLPFAFLTLYPRIHGFDRSLEEAAMDLGARPFEVFRRVTLPVVLPGILATALFSFSLSFDEFIRTLFVIGFDRTIPVAFWSLIVQELAPELPAMAVIIVFVSVFASLVGFVFARRADARARETGGNG